MNRIVRRPYRPARRGFLQEFAHLLDTHGHGIELTKNTVRLVRDDMAGPSCRAGRAVEKITEPSRSACNSRRNSLPSPESAAGRRIRRACAASSGRQGLGGLEVLVVGFFEESMGHIDEPHAILAGLGQSYNATCANSAHSSIYLMTLYFIAHPASASLPSPASHAHHLAGRATSFKLVIARQVLVGRER